MCLMLGRIDMSIKNKEFGNGLKHTYELYAIETEAQLCGEKMGYAIKLEQLAFYLGRSEFDPYVKL